MIAQLSQSSTITISVIGFFAFLAIVVLARSLLTKKDSTWRRIRIGFFIERDPKGGEDSDTEGSV